MDKNKEYMTAAIQAAEAAKSEGGVAIGAVLVDDTTGSIVASGGSIVGITHDPTSHAEVNCIRAASKRLNSDDLYGYTLYSTLEPCHMCLSAAAWARIQKVYFGAFRKDVDESLFDIKGKFSDEQEAARMNLRENFQMEVHGGVLEDACAKLLGTYHDRAKHSVPGLISR
ncbi:MAG TPA: nucleoside deaminase [Verrucomicrobiae bacterium]|nr:nucleoside deaminase [Verrucomicrobiae bacterium]